MGNLILLSLTFIVIDLIGNDNEKQVMEDYCKIECKNYKKLDGYHRLF